MKVIIGMGYINFRNLIYRRDKYFKRWVVRITWNCNGGGFEDLGSFGVREDKIK